MIRSLIFIFLTIFCVSVWAGNEKNDCGRLHIQIGNATKTACQLLKTKVIHGKLISSPPAMIPAGYTDRFDVFQTFSGPNVAVEYRCNGQQITLASAQNYCFLEAGQVNGSITERSGSLYATHTSENGSYYWGKPGLINWVITSN